MRLRRCHDSVPGGGTPLSPTPSPRCPAPFPNLIFDLPISSAPDHSNRRFLVVTSNMATSDSLIIAAKRLRDAVAEMRFAAPVAHVYDPLIYAWRAHEIYLRRYGNSPKRILFLGMNPGPFGMTQTGVPFGEIAAVRDWLGIQTDIARPDGEHPKRPIEGFQCKRSEVSGRRLWGLFAQRFGSAEKFSADHIV